MTDTLSKIRATILRLLARRDYTQLEISRYLKNKNYEDKEIESVIAEFMQKNLINEQRFTENFIHWRQGRGYGPKRIAMELEARGVSAQMIAELLDMTDNAWSHVAKRIWQKQFKSKLPNDFKTRAKQMRFLYQRGFTQSHINTVFETDVDIDNVE